MFGLFNSREPKITDYQHQEMKQKYADVRTQINELPTEETELSGLPPLVLTKRGSFPKQDIEYWTRFISAVDSSMNHLNPLLDSRKIGATLLDLSKVTELRNMILDSNGCTMLTDAFEGGKIRKEKWKAISGSDSQANEKNANSPIRYAPSPKKAMRPLSKLVNDDQRVAKKSEKIRLDLDDDFLSGSPIDKVLDTLGLLTTQFKQLVGEAGSENVGELTKMKSDLELKLVEVKQTLDKIEQFPNARWNQASESVQKQIVILQTAQEQLQQLAQAQPDQIASAVKNSMTDVQAQLIQLNEKLQQKNDVQVDKDSETVTAITKLTKSVAKLTTTLGDEPAKIESSVAAGMQNVQQTVLSLTEQLQAQNKEGDNATSKALELLNTTITTALNGLEHAKREHVAQVSVANKIQEMESKLHEATQFIAEIKDKQLERTKNAEERHQALLSSIAENSSKGNVDKLVQNYDAFSEELRKHNLALAKVNDSLSHDENTRDEEPSAAIVKVFARELAKLNEVQTAIDTNLKELLEKKAKKAELETEEIELHDPVENEENGELERLKQENIRLQQEIDSLKIPKKNDAYSIEMPPSESTSLISHPVQKKKGWSLFKPTVIGLQAITVATVASLWVWGGRKETTS